MGVAQWMISVRRGNKHQYIMVDKNDYETDVEVFERAKQRYLQIKEKYQDFTVELISRKKAFAPKQDKQRGHLYCPYCRVNRRFQNIEKTGNKHCPICNISDADYYVRKYNKLWSTK